MPSINVPYLRNALLPLVAIGAFFFAAACSTQEDSRSTNQTANDGKSALQELGYDTSDVPGLIDALDEAPLDQRPTNLMASVRPNELVITAEAGAETSLPIPDDRFYVSIAPYAKNTHECHFHSLTTCRGELSKAKVDLKVVNKASGEVLVDGTKSTFDNGFVGVWLPKGIEAEVTIKHDGKRATTTVDTRAEDSATCITTMRLT